MTKKAITLWEILEFGKIPFAEYSNIDAVKKIVAGERYE